MIAEIDSQSSLSLEDFTFVPRGQKHKQVRTVPTFLTGVLGQTIAQMHERAKREIYGNNNSLKLSYDGAQVIQSTFFDAVLVDNLVRTFGVNTPTLSDLGNQDLMRAAKDNHYIDSRDLVLVSTEDSSDSRKNGIARELAERVNLSKGPVLVRGFTLEPWANDDKGYGFKVVPRDDFITIQDDRLLRKYNGWKFYMVDAQGFPVGLDKEKGRRTWYTRNDGLSRLILDSDLDLGSSWDQLDLSNSNGRVALVGREAGAR